MKQKFTKGFLYIDGKKISEIKSFDFEVNNKEYKLKPKTKRQYTFIVELKPITIWDKIKLWLKRFFK